MNVRSLVPSTQSNALQRFDFNPFAMLQREVDRLFDDFTGAPGTSGRSGALNLVPTMDVAETEKQIELTVELPGLERKDVDISVEDGVLTIRGEKKAETEQKDKNFHLAERSYGSFYRSMILPRGVDPSSIQAKMANGVLRITIPKPEKPESQKIEVKEAA